MLCISQVRPKTSLFYIELISAFRLVGLDVELNISSVLETGNVHLWNNYRVTADNSVPKSPILKNAGIFRLKDIGKSGQLISFQNIARMST